MSIEIQKQKFLFEKKMYCCCLIIVIFWFHGSMSFNAVVVFVIKFSFFIHIGSGHTVRPSLHLSIKKRSVALNLQCSNFFLILMTCFPVKDGLKIYESKKRLPFFDTHFLIPSEEVSNFSSSGLKVVTSYFYTAFLGKQVCM